ncbi:MAG TPA: DUF302 domain-containing protein [Streptosporangiaceae bacterium]
MTASSTGRSSDTTEATMSGPSTEEPAGAPPVDGIVHTRSPHTVGQTVDLLTQAIHEAGATLFAVVDHSGEAERAGLSLRDTKLLIFGSPNGGTPAMVAAPAAAIDLPLKLLVWQDDNGMVWISHIDPHWLAGRYGLLTDLTAPLAAAGALAAKVTGTGRT